LAVVVLAAVVLAACGSSGPATSSSSSTTSTTTQQEGAAAATSWVKDTTTALNVFLPDADSVYWFNGYGTASGSTTVISGQVPEARYWSFTAYPLPDTAARQHVHDTEVATQDGRYTVTIATSCTGVPGSCLAMGAGNDTGVVVFRLYVPADIAGAGDGEVPLPSITYQSASGAPQTLTEAAGSTDVEHLLDGFRAEHGATPPGLDQNPAPQPVAHPVNTPPPPIRLSNGEGPFANPDNVYAHVLIDTARGDLLLRAQAPTYQEDSLPRVNSLAVPASQDPQVRYWSLCTVLQGRHTGSCVRDAQVRFPPNSTTFSVLVAAKCPVAGYANCITAGPPSLQQSVSYRNLLPSASFAPQALTGPYALRATYVARGQ